MVQANIQYIYDPKTGTLKKERDTRGLTPRQRKIKLEEDKRQGRPFREYHA